jgi:hypothetical protein
VGGDQLEPMAGRAFQHCAALHRENVPRDGGLSRPSGFDHVSRTEPHDIFFGIMRGGAMIMFKMSASSCT